MVQKCKLFEHAKVVLKCDCVEGNILDGVGQIILVTFAVDKNPDFKTLCEPEKNTIKILYLYLIFLRF